MIYKKYLIPISVIILLTLGIFFNKSNTKNPETFQSFDKPEYIDYKKDILSAGEKLINSSTSAPYIIEENIQEVIGKMDAFYEKQASDISATITNYKFAPGEPLNFVTFFDGVYPIAIFSRSTNHKIDYLVSFGMPINNKYWFDENNIKVHINVFSKIDFPTPTRYIGHPGSIYGAINVDVSDIASTGKYKDEEDFYYSDEVWERVKPFINSSVPKPQK